MKLGVHLDIDIDELTRFTETTLTAVGQSGIDFTVFFDRLTLVASGENKSIVMELFVDKLKA